MSATDPTEGPEAVTPEAGASEAVTPEAGASETHGSLRAGWADDAVPGPVRLAGALTLVEAAGLGVAGAVLAIKTATSGADSVARALLGAAFALFGVLVLYFCARGLLTRRLAARSPLLVLQILALPVGYSLGIQAGLYYYGVPILLAAVVVLGALFHPVTRAWLERRPPPGTDPADGPGDGRGSATRR